MNRCSHSQFSNEAAHSPQERAEVPHINTCAAGSECRECARCSVCGLFLCAGGSAGCWPAVRDRLGEEQETAESGAACSGSREWAAAAAAAGEVIHGDGSR